LIGVRYVTKKDGLRILSAVRCSALKYQAYQKEQCTLLDFNDKVQDQRGVNTTATSPWQHECPHGYAMVGLYDDENNNFKNLQKAKCCKLIGENKHHNYFVYSLF